MDDRGIMDDGLSSDATPGSVAMDDEDAKAAGAEDDTNVENVELAEQASNSSRRSSSGDSTTPPPSNTTDRKQAEIEVLQAENALLRLALEETQAKLTAATNVGRSVRPIRSRSRSISSASKEPGNGGVAYAQMRRLLLKDERFLRDTFLPFLNMDDFGRLSSVCRRLKRSTYDLDVVVRCVESGGVTDATRGLLWLIMVGMDTVKPSSRGVLGVVILGREESPEEQYDRLHRAMNGTTAAVATATATATASPKAHSRQTSAASSKMHSRQASMAMAPTIAAATAADDNDDAVGDGENGGETIAAVAVAEGARSQDGNQPNREQEGARVGEISVGDNESVESDRDNSGSNGGSRSRVNSGSSTGGGDAGGTGGRLSGGGSVVTDASVAGDASVGGESVLLWEDSDNGRGTAKTSTSPRVQLQLQAANGGFATTAAATTDEQASAKSAAAAAAEAAEMAAMAKEAAEAAGAAFDAEAAAGIRPLGGRQGAAATAAAKEEAAEAVEAAAEAAATAAGLAEAAADAVDASTPVRAEQEGHAGAGGMAGGSPSQQQRQQQQQQTPPAAASSATSGVVGWASGLFRRTPGANSPQTGAAAAAAAAAAAPSSAAATGANGASSPRVTRRSSEASQEQRPNSNDNGNDSGPPAPSSPLMSRMSSAGRLFGGLRYSRANANANATATATASNTTPRSALPADNPSPSNSTTKPEPFFGKNSGGKDEDGSAGAANTSTDGDSSSEKEDGEPPFERVPGLYAALLMSADAMDANDMTGVRGPKQSCFVDIEKDLQRTLGMTDVTPLRNVLRCTSTFVPDVGYVQGMNFVCRSLLQVYRDEEEAFWVFVGMLQRFRLRELYCPGMPLLRLRFFQLNRLLMWHLPELFEHFEACGVQTNLFATSWFMTLLSDGGMLPDEEVRVVWDRIFLHSNSPASQWAPMFLFLLELLRRASEALKKESRFSELIQRLVNMPFRDLCRGNGACSTIEEARRRFETSSPMPVQLLLLHDQWVEGGEEEEANSPGHDGEKQLL